MKCVLCDIDTDLNYPICPECDDKMIRKALGISRKAIDSLLKDQPSDATLDEIKEVVDQYKKKGH